MNPKDPELEANGVVFDGRHVKKRPLTIRLLIALVVLIVVLPLLWIAMKNSLEQRSAERYLDMARADGYLGKHSPSEGFVPNKETAIAIAVAVWKPIYGDEPIKRQAPYRATLVDGIWVVRGNMKGLAPGGTAKALIRQDTGEILQTIHEF